MKKAFLFLRLSKEKGECWQRTESRCGLKNEKAHQTVVVLGAVIMKAPGLLHEPGKDLLVVKLLDTQA